MLSLYIKGHVTCALFRVSSGYVSNGVTSLQAGTGAGTPGDRTHHLVAVVTSATHRAIGQKTGWDVMIR